MSFYDKKKKLPEKNHKSLQCFPLCRSIRLQSLHHNKYYWEPFNHCPCYPWLGHRKLFSGVKMGKCSIEFVMFANKAQSSNQNCYLRFLLLMMFYLFSIQINQMCANDGEGQSLRTSWTYMYQSKTIIWCIYCCRKVAEYWLQFQMHGNDHTTCLSEKKDKFWHKIFFSCSCLLNLIRSCAHMYKRCTTPS